MRLVRIGLRLVGAVVLLAVLYVGYITYTVWHMSTVDEAAAADAIVVLGAAQYNGVPSPVLRARLDHAAELWKGDYADRIVVTGGRAPGDTSTEAGASAAYLATKGVPDEAVLREVDGRSSWQSLQAAALFMKERDINKVILVSDSFHDARISAMAKDLNLEPLVSPTKTSPIVGTARRPYFVKEIAAMAVGVPFGFSRVASLEATVVT